jgi:hypothetical protein
MCQPSTAVKLSLVSIHPTSGNRYSRKFVSKILHSPAPIPPESYVSGTPHSPAPLELVTPMDRYARSWKFFLQINVCTSERTPLAPSLMLQVAPSGRRPVLRVVVRREEAGPS